MMPGQVQTVLGPVAPKELGLTLPHEHLLVRVEGWAITPRTKEQAEFAAAPVTLDNLAELHRRAYSNVDNLRISDEGTVHQEVQRFAKEGGRSLVDLTVPSLGRDVAAQKRISERTGVHVIAGCGYYIEAAHPPEVESLSVEALAGGLVRELTTGMDGSGIRAGVIGELGTGNPITQNEKKVLRAGAAAHRATGAPLSVHLFPASGCAREVLDILEAEGVEPTRIALCHLDDQDPIDVDAHLELAARGAYVEYDVFGASWTNDDVRDEYSDRLYWSPPPSDQARVRAIIALCEGGLGERVLISHDVCTKIQQAAWGGSGFVHIPRYMLPFFEANGIAPDVIHRLVRSNPQRWLTWTAPSGSMTD